MSTLFGWIISVLFNKQLERWHEKRMREDEEKARADWTRLSGHDRP